jgi:hypothetical protein
MPNLEYFLVCESMSTDRETNRVSLFNILEEIQAPSPDGPPSPAIPVAGVVAVCCWNQEQDDEDEDFQVMIRIHAPGQEVQEFPINFKMDQPRHRLALRFPGVPKTDPGQLKFELCLNGKHVAWHTVSVKPADENAPIGPDD